MVIVTHKAELRQLLAAREEELREKHKRNFDRRHRARDLSPALPGDMVWVLDRRETGTVGNQVSPRSYRVKTPCGSFRRNKRDITPLLEVNDTKRTPGGDQTPKQDRTWDRRRHPPFLHIGVHFHAGAHA